MPAMAAAAMYQQKRIMQLQLSALTSKKTRKLCCRKDDRAMRPMGALNFWDSLTTPTATIPNIFYGLMFRSSL